MQQAPIRINTKGGAGAATGQANTNYSGLLRAITVKFHASAPAGTRVRIFLGIGGVETEIVDRTGNTAFNHFPGIQLQDKAGAGLTNAYVQPIGDFFIRIDVSASNELEEAVTVLIQ